MISTPNKTSSSLPASRFHPFARLFIATAGALLATVLMVLTIGVASAVAAALSGRDAAAQVEQFFTDNLLLANLLVYPPVLLWLWFCRRFFDRRPFVSLGLRARGIFIQSITGVASGFLAVALIFGVLWLSGNLQVRGISLEAQSSGWGISALILCGWALMMLCVGLFEEIAFRGYAFHNLNAWLGARSANVLQAIVFALIHLGNLAAQDTSTPDATLAALLAMPNIFLIGIFFTISYLKTGSLWFPIAFHAAWNFFLGCVFSLPVSGLPIFQIFDVSVSGSTPLTGGAFGPEASLLLTPILLVMIFVTTRLSDAPQAVADLQSLQASQNADEETMIEPEEVMTKEQQTLAEEARENRFKTRMGARATEVDEETQSTLRALNETRREPPSTPAFPIVIEPAPIAVETRKVETKIEEVESTPAAPIEVAEPAAKVPATEPQPSTPDEPAPKRKPAPRW